MMIWIMEKRKNFQLRPMSIMDRLMLPVVKRDRRGSLLLLSLECWLKVHQVLKGQQVFLDPQVLLVLQAVLEILERGVLPVGPVFPELMAYQDLREQS